MPSDEKVEKVARAIWLAEHKGDTEAEAQWDRAIDRALDDHDGELPGWIVKRKLMAESVLAAMGEREAVAEIVSKYGDPAAFAEREVHLLADIQKMPVGTKLYASPRHEAEIARLTEARRKDAEAFESLRNANTIVRDRAKDAEALVERYRIALADAIRRPMGVIPGSAEGLVTADDLDAAEERRQERESSP